MRPMPGNPHLCLTCRWAEWYKTANGRLHPGGDGKCGWEMPEIRLPAVYYYPADTSRRRVPSPSGGSITQKTDAAWVRPVTSCDTYEAKP